MWQARSTSMLSLLQFMAVARRQGLTNVAVARRQGLTNVARRQGLTMAEEPQQPLIASLSHLATVAGEPWMSRHASLSFVVD